MRKITILIFIAFIINSCDIFESDATVYFDVIGEGYAYNRDTNKPIPFAKICVDTGFESHGWATKQPVFEYFIADSLGFFKVKFIKRTEKESPTGYSVFVNGYIGSPENMSSTSSGFDLSFNDIKNSKNNINIDTLKASFDY